MVDGVVDCLLRDAEEVCGNLGGKSPFHAPPADAAGDVVEA